MQASAKYSWSKLPSRTVASSLLLRNDKIRRKTQSEIPQGLSL